MMTPDERQEFDMLKEKVDSLDNSSTISFDVDGAFRDRFSDLFNPFEVSSKDLDTEDQAVNEAGSGTYNVLKEPDGFLEITLDGTVYYLPYYG